MFLLISFPAQMTTWPMPLQRSYIDAVTGATTLDKLKNHAGDIPDLLDMLLGKGVLG